MRDSSTVMGFSTMLESQYIYRKSALLTCPRTIWLLMGSLSVPHCEALMAAGTISSIPLPCQYLSMTSLLATVLLGGVPGGGSAGHSVGAMRDYCTGLVHNEWQNQLYWTLLAIPIKLVFLFTLQRKEVLLKLNGGSKFYTLSRATRILYESLYQCYTIPRRKALKLKFLQNSLLLWTTSIW